MTLRISTIERFYDEDGRPDIVDETDPTKIFVGWFAPGTPDTANAENAEICKILCIQKDAAITRMLWADGDKSYNKIWLNRGVYTYLYRQV